MPAAVAAAVTPGVVVSRISGADRFEVAIRISQRGFPSGAGTVFVASGLNYPDALTAGPAAVAAGAPLLLVNPAQLSSSVAAEIKRLAPQQVVIVGGGSAVSRGVADAIARLGTSVTRLAGSDRYATSRVVAAHMSGTTDPATAYMSTGWNFPDAVSAGAAAGSKRQPVLLVNGGQSTTDSATRSSLASLAVDGVKILGGSDVVSSGIASSLSVSGYGVKRLAGTDRFASSIAINADSFTTSPTVYLATGHDYPDALAGSALAGKQNAPLFVIPSTCVPQGVLGEIARLQASSVVLLGSQEVLTSDVDSLTSCDGATSPVKLQTYTPPAAVGSDKLSFAVAGSNTTTKKVFAHYFPPYPVSFENADPSVDYYTRNYLRPEGEGGIHAAYGGLLRDRPVGRPVAAGDWRVADMKSEVIAASDAGIDGFTVDIMGFTGQNWDRTVALTRGAEQSGRNFTIVPNLDMTASVGTTAMSTIGVKLAELYRSPSAYRLATGEYVLSSFAAEKQTPQWWAQLKTTMLQNHGIKIAFIAVFLNASDANMQAFAPISYALGNWGVRTPSSIRSAPDYAVKARALGVKWMAPVAVQDVRPRSYLYAEANNTETLRASWEKALSTGADLIQLVTWNDYSEGTSFAPSVAHGASFLDINAYYQTRFKTGAAPAITGDSLYITHRTQSFSAIPQLNYRRMSPTLSGTATAPRDTVEVLTFLVAPARVRVNIGTTALSYDAPAGVFAKTFPLALGSVSANATRSGSTVLQVNSPFKVVAKPLVEDLQYFAVSSRRK